VALARELPHATIVATDISGPALEVARRNATRNGVADQIQFIETDLLAAALNEPEAAGHEKRAFDLIVSNPPYVAASDAASLQREVRDHEPASALFGGPTGMEIYTRLIGQAASLLRPQGILVLELGYGAADAVRRMFHVQQAWANVSLTNDLAGIPRVIAAERTASTS
jgi:release factor glutamine methyltransferase